MFISQRELGEISVARGHRVSSRATLAWLYRVARTKIIRITKTRARGARLMKTVSQFRRTGRTTGERDPPGEATRVAITVVRDSLSCVSINGRTARQIVARAPITRADNASADKLNASDKRLR